MQHVCMTVVISSGAYFKGERRPALSVRTLVSHSIKIGDPLGREGKGRKERRQNNLDGWREDRTTGGLQMEDE